MSFSNLVLESKKITFSNQDSVNVSFDGNHTTPYVTVTSDDMGPAFNFYVSQVTSAGCVVESSGICTGTVNVHVMSQR
tara:strand:- start:63 stop:296 length:234 start_codon:yes stop_codon:yes gene_type:complete